MIPDTEGALKTYLSTYPAVVSSAAAGRCFLATRSNVEFPYVLVSRLGGGDAPGDAPMDLALIQVDVYGRVVQLAEAGAVLNAVLEALAALNHTDAIVPGKARLAGAIVRDRRRIPEPEAQDVDGTVGERPRYAVTVQVTGLPTSA